MPTINANIADYLVKIEALTNTNLQILKSINDSFYTSKNHIYTTVDDSTYVFPSFVSLENKINMLQSNFENLVNAPETGEAYFNFDGNTRAIEVRKYTQVPNALTLPTVSSFGAETNNVLRDFLSPLPYINFDVPALPNDIVDVCVKKIVAKSDIFKSVLAAKLNELASLTTSNTTTCSNLEYSIMNKMLLGYTKGVDYLEYDTMYKLPMRKNIGTGLYVIKSIVSDSVDDDLNEVVTLTFHDDLNTTDFSGFKSNLTYTLFDDTIDKNLKIGDELVTYNGKCKMVITDVKPLINTVTVKIVNGEFANLLPTNAYNFTNAGGINDYSKLKFYAAVDYDADKYVKVPLEDDQYVFVAIAAVNSRLNLMSAWGTGVLLDTHTLMNGDLSFTNYYNSNVKNIGTALNELSLMLTDPVTTLTTEEYTTLANIKPVINKTDLNVWQINDHLDKTPTVQNIRAAYNDKKTAEAQLNAIQAQIDETNSKLYELVFNDATGERTVYENNLQSLSAQKRTYLDTINTAINTISNSVSSSTVPIENAKYRIRGFYIPKLDNVNSITTNNHVIGLQVQYRYKNVSSTVGTAKSISSADGSETFIYSDWNELNTRNKAKLITLNSGSYVYDYEANNESKNEPSYNQIDIPITQGESVDVRLRVLYDFGQPFVSMTSAWSDIVNIEFPEEFTKNAPILSIIEENNNDIATNKFRNLIETAGINTHCDSKVVDQGITYFHKADNIASGFYTEDRRIIPLLDKLQSMSEEIAFLKSNITGSLENCQVYLQIGAATTDLYPDRDNTINLEPYNKFMATINGFVNEEDDSTSTDHTYADIVRDVKEAVNNDLELKLQKYLTPNNAYEIVDDVVSTMANLCITNTSDLPVKLYAILPGKRETTINDTTFSFNNLDSYRIGTNGGVRYKYEGMPANTPGNGQLQKLNQFITFRVKDAWTPTAYYTNDATPASNRLQSSTGITDVTKDMSCAMVVYPYLSNLNDLCLENTNNNKSFKTIAPGETVIIPIFCSYKVSEASKSITKVLSFDVKTSLYGDPTNYTIEFVAQNSSTKEQRVYAANAIVQSERGRANQRIGFDSNSGGLWKRFQKAYTTLISSTPTIK